MSAFYIFKCTLSCDNHIVVILEAEFMSPFLFVSYENMLSMLNYLNLFAAFIWGFAVVLSFSFS